MAYDPIYGDHRRRPRKTVKRSASLSIRLTDAELAQLKANAADAGHAKLVAYIVERCCRAGRKPKRNGN